MRARPLGIALLLAAAVHAQGKPTPVPEAVAPILAAYQKKDIAALKAFALDDKRDPWLVADLLCRAGQFDAALAYARAAPRADIARLPATIESWRKAPRDPAVIAATELPHETDDERAQLLDRLDRLRGAPNVFDRIVIGLTRGNLLGTLRRHDEAAEAFIEAAATAERIGWLAKASAAFSASAMQARRAVDHSAMRLGWERLRAVEEARGRASGVARAVMFLGNVAAELGDYHEAKARYRAADEAYRAAGDARGRAWVLTNLGHTHYLAGEFRAAQEVWEKALELGKGHAFREASVIGKLAMLHDALGDHERALAGHRRALRIWESLGYQPRIADCLGNLSIVYQRLGRYEECFENLRRARAVYEKERDKASLCKIQLNLAWAHLEKGEPEAALSIHREALEALRDIDDPWLEANANQNIAVNYVELKQYEKARAANDRGQRLAGRLASRKLLFDGHVTAAKIWLGEKNYARAAHAARRAIDEFAQMTAGLGETQIAAARGRRAEVFDVAVEAAARWGNAPELYRFLESGRAGALLESLEGRDDIQAAAIPEALRRVERERKSKAAAAQRRFQQAVAQGDRRVIRKRRGELNGAREAVRDIVERIQREAKAGANILYPAAAPLEDAQRVLRPNEAFVLYGLLKEQSVALVVTKKAARIVTLGPREEIEQASVLHLEDRRDSSSAIARLARAVVAPLGLAKDVRRVLVSPDGMLGYVPFELLCGGREVVYLPSGTTYGILRDQRKRSGRRVIAVGDPTTGVVADGERGGAAPLPAARKEARRVGDVVLIGEQATKRRLVAAIEKEERWSAVHLACHCIVERERPSASSLLLATDGKDAGLLTCVDLFHLKIPADLVVLSACETGKGKVYRAEGVVGFTRAFMFAGAPRVIVSLWKVDDEATQALMVKFYEEWKKHPTATALKKAQAFVRGHEKWKHPYYWAAWQLWGLPD